MTRSWIRHLTQFEELVIQEGIMTREEISKLDKSLRSACDAGPYGFYSDLGFELLNVIEKRSPAKYPHLRSVAKSHNFFRKMTE